MSDISIPIAACRTRKAALKAKGWRCTERGTVCVCKKGAATPTPRTTPPRTGGTRRRRRTYTRVNTGNMPQPFPELVRIGRRTYKSPNVLPPIIKARIAALTALAKAAVNKNDLKKLGKIVAKLKKLLAIDLPGTGRRMHYRAYYRIYRQLRGRIGYRAARTQAKAIREAFRYGAVRFQRWQRNTYRERAAISNVFASTGARALLDKIITLAKKTNPTDADMAAAIGAYEGALKKLASELKALNLPANFGYADLISTLNNIKLRPLSNTPGKKAVVATVKDIQSLLKGLVEAVVKSEPGGGSYFGVGNFEQAFSKIISRIEARLQNASKWGLRDEGIVKKLKTLIETIRGGRQRNLPSLSRLEGKVTRAERVLRALSGARLEAAFMKPNMPLGLVTSFINKVAKAVQARLRAARVPGNVVKLLNFYATVTPHALRKNTPVGNRWFGPEGPAAREIVKMFAGIIKIAKKFKKLPDTMQNRMMFRTSIGQAIRTYGTHAAKQLAASLAANKKKMSFWEVSVAEKLIGHLRALANDTSVRIAIDNAPTLPKKIIAVMNWLKGNHLSKWKFKGKTGFGLAAAIKKKIEAMLRGITGRVIIDKEKTLHDDPTHRKLGKSGRHRLKVSAEGGVKSALTSVLTINGTQPLVRGDGFMPGVNFPSSFGVGRQSRLGAFGRARLSYAYTTPRLSVELSGALGGVHQNMDTNSIPTLSVNNGTVTATPDAAGTSAASRLSFDVRAAITGKVLPWLKLSLLASAQSADVGGNLFDPMVSILGRAALGPVEVQAGYQKGDDITQTPAHVGTVGLKFNGNYWNQVSRHGLNPYASFRANFGNQPFFSIPGYKTQLDGVGFIGGLRAEVGLDYAKMVTKWLHMKAALRAFLDVAIPNDSGAGSNSTIWVQPSDSTAPPGSALLYNISNPLEGFSTSRAVSPGIQLALRPDFHVGSGVWLNPFFTLTYQNARRGFNTGGQHNLVLYGGLGISWGANPTAVPALTSDTDSEPRPAARRAAPRPAPARRTSPAPAPAPARRTAARPAPTPAPARRARPASAASCNTVPASSSPENVIDAWCGKCDPNGSKQPSLCNPLD